MAITSWFKSRKGQNPYGTTNAAPAAPQSREDRDAHERTLYNGMTYREAREAMYEDQGRRDLAARRKAEAEKPAPYVEKTYRPSGFSDPTEKKDDHPFYTATGDARPAKWY